MAVKSYQINVKDFGAKGDGVTDDSAAFKSALAYIINSVVTNPGAAAVGDSNKRGRIKLIIPEGCFVINSPEALMPSSYTTRTLGLTIEGYGSAVSQILYKNTVASKYLLYNNDAWLYLNIKGIEFISDNINNNFMYSLSNGGAQGYIFDNCLWSGSWNHVIRLEGSNTNSEMSWNNCRWTGTINKGVYVPPSNSSDQFLNYNFYACNFEVSSGDFLHFEKGGSINVWGGSFIHIGTGTGTFFKLLGNTHAYGTQRFICIGGRFEHRSSNSKLVECEWNDGAVSFINCDTSTQAFAVSSYNNSKFTSTNSKMPVIKFDNCSLMGKHEYSYAVSSWAHPHNVIYENCEFSQANTAAEFITYTNVPGFNWGGTPTIQFRNCRSQNNTNITAYFDCTLGIEDASRGTLQTRIASIRTPSGEFPISGAAEDFWLPMNSVITRIRLYRKPGMGASTATAWKYDIKTSETTPTILATVGGNGVSQLKDGFSDQFETFFVCNADDKRHLILQSNSSVDHSTDQVMCLIEYIN